MVNGSVLRASAITEIDSPNRGGGPRLIAEPLIEPESHSTDLKSWKSGGDRRRNVVGTWESDWVSRGRGRLAANHADSTSGNRGIGILRVFQFPLHKRL